MNIIVLAGGLSPERHVSLVSGTSICRALRNLGHKAVLVDMFLGLEDYEGDLADLFDAPGGLCGEAVIHRPQCQRHFSGHNRTALCICHASLYQTCLRKKVLRP